jgi:hypothetical protein
VGVAAGIVAWLWLVPSWLGFLIAGVSLILAARTGLVIALRRARTGAPRS